MPCLHVGKLPFVDLKDINLNLKLNPSVQAATEDDEKLERKEAKKPLSDMVRRGGKSCEKSILALSLI